jgi:hypothetical protein
MKNIIINAIVENFIPMLDVIKGVSEKMLKIANKYGVKLSTCAEPGVIPGISKQGCLSV